MVNKQDFFVVFCIVLNLGIRLIMCLCSISTGKFLHNPGGGNLMQLLPMLMSKRPYINVIAIDVDFLHFN